jgi:predicted NBD/HSP70 family sugar kinase
MSGDSQEDLPQANGRNAVGAGAILRLLIGRQSRTRAELVDLTGLGRSTVSQRLELLASNGLIVPAGPRESTGGRPPIAVAFNAGAGIILAGDLGATHARVGITDLAGEVLHEEAAEIPIAYGPDRVLGWLEVTFEKLIADQGFDLSDVRGVGVGLPGPVEFATGVPVAPPIMPGWDGYEVATRLRERFGTRVLVDNDVNIMAVGEHWSCWPGSPHLLFVKVATGIGCGIVTEGHVHRGAQGAAGDIGHIRVPGYDDVVCGCGNVGCLEAVASGGALAARLTALGLPATNSRDVVRHVRDGTPEAVSAVRQAGRDIGTVLATAVNLFNPGIIVIGGDMAQADEALLAGIREVVYQRSTPLATRAIRIVKSALDDRAGVIGAAVIAIESILEPTAIDLALAT